MSASTKQLVIGLRVIGLAAAGFAATVQAAEGAAAAAPVAGAKPPQVAVCAACHGENGVSNAPTFPNLAGQHRNYLEVALHGYKSGARKNQIMAAQAVNLTDADIKALAAWYSGQQAVLYTPGLDGVARKSASATPAPASAAGAAKP